MNPTPKCSTCNGAGHTNDIGWHGATVCPSCGGSGRKRPAPKGRSDG